MTAARYVHTEIDIQLDIVAMEMSSVVMSASVCICSSKVFKLLCQDRTL